MEMIITASNDARYYSANEGHGECIIDMKLERGFSVVVAMVRQDVEECSNYVQIFTSDI